jgi:hypothetical protein
MAKAVGTLVENAKGKSVKYKNGDLSYDIKCKYFEWEAKHGPNSTTKQ